MAALLFFAWLAFGVLSVALYMHAYNRTLRDDYSPLRKTEFVDCVETEFYNISYGTLIAAILGIIIWPVTILCVIVFWIVDFAFRAKWSNKVFKRKEDS